MKCGVLPAGREASKVRPRSWFQVAHLVLTALDRMEAGMQKFIIERDMIGRAHV